MATHKKPGKWRARTQAVRGGQIRTPFQETSEALFLTSGYAYEAPEEAEARFKAGLGTALELADAEYLRTEAEIQLAGGQFELSRTRAVLGKLMAEES